MGATTGISSAASETDIESSVQSILAARNIQGGSVTVSTTDGTPFNSVSRGDLFTVNVEIQYTSNKVGPVFFLGGTNIEGTATARRQ